MSLRFCLALITLFNSTQLFAHVYYSPRTVVVRAQTRFEVSNKGAQNLSTLQLKALTPLTRSSSPSVTLEVNTDNFGSSDLAPDELNLFGSLKISVEDQDLSVCGRNKTTRCSVAGLRMYTAGTPNPGLWSSSEWHGPSLYFVPSPDSLKVVGLNPIGAVTLKSFELSENKSAITGSDFNSTPYSFKLDLIGFDLGEYYSIVVVEYFLALD